MTITTEPLTARAGAPTPPAPAPITAVIELPAEQIAQHPDNLRDATRGIRELAASIAEVGVLVPLIVVPVAAVPDHDFEPQVTHVAVDGNRRQRAARQAGLPLPCIVRPDLDTAREHALTMAVTGLARDGLTVSEEAHAVQTMLDLGIDASAIGRATGRTRKHVSTARKAARLSGDLADAAAAQDLTLTDLAALTEWQHDPAAVELLADAMGRGQLAHTLAQLDMTRLERQLTARTVRELTAAGVRCITERPRWRGTPCELSCLRAADAAPGEQITPDAHAGCPGHVAHVDVTIYPADDQAEEHIVETVTYGCADPAAYGHPDRWAAVTTDPPGSDTTDQAADDTDDVDDVDDHARAERAQRQREEEAARADAARRQERSDLISRNKQAEAARQVRHQFLRDCLTARSRHQDMTAYALHQVLTRDATVTAWLTDWAHRDRVLTDVLGDDPIDTATAAIGQRRLVMLWAYVVAAHEHAMPRDAHRDTDHRRADYLRHLEQIGYVLSDVEQLVITRAYPDDTPATTGIGGADAQPTDDEAADAGRTQ